MKLFRLKDGNHRNQKFNGSALLLVVLVAACFAISPIAKAVVPPPDGGYPNGNTAEGNGALFSLTAGTYNTAVGLSALYSDTRGNRNTAVGLNVLRLNTSGNRNTAVGAEALRFNVASGNTAIGDSALFHNTTGVDNAATGWRALFSNTTGDDNSANGSTALYHNTTGFKNTANGFQALFSNTTGVANTANGDQALYSNTEGGNNTANGFLALQRNTIGSENTANGTGALQFNTIGDWNTAEGFEALSRNTTGRDNTANGFQALVFNTTGHDNIALGFGAGAQLTTGNFNIDIGNQGVAAESDTIRVGTQGTQTNAYVAGIFGTTVPNGVPVIVDPTGHLGTIASSQRFKDEIKPMDNASEAILALKPVTFRYKHEFDPGGIPQFGLVAEEVEKVNPALVARDAKGQVYTVRYEAVNAMLLNEFLKEHDTVQELKSTVLGQQSIMAQQRQSFERRLAEQEKQIKALTCAVEKVNVQLGMNASAPQVAANQR